MKNMNKHIENYLKSYLELDKPEFAVLLTGKWGSGKTHFINKFIEKNQKEDELKFIKISLFGLKEIDSIDEEIFQNLHPFLGNKYTRIVGNIAKNSLKLGATLDWDDDEKKDGTGTVDLSKFNPLDFFSDKKKSKVKIIFIFDDLERTDIELTEVLGYINYLVEQSEFNVIILANEEKVIEEESKNKSSKYVEFKEKVIGKTFEVQHDFDRILISLISKNTKKSKKYLNENKDIIGDIYSKAEHNNLRHIKQILLDFEYFIKLIDEKYLEDTEFISLLIKNFFIFSIELKSSHLYLKDDTFFYRKKIDCFEEERLYREKKDNDNKEECAKERKTCNKEEMQKLYRKYDIDSKLIFSQKIWINIVVKNNVDKKKINELINNLGFFLVEEQANKIVSPSWVRLWYYRELENTEFEELIQDVLDKFKSCLYEKPEHFLHVISLLIYFYEEGLSSFSIKEIQNQVEACIKKYKTSSIWKDKLFGDMRGHAIGFEYLSNEKDAFTKLFEFIMAENKKIYYVNEKLKEKNDIEDFLESLETYNNKIVEELLLAKYRDKPILNSVDIKDFIKKITNLDNKNLGYFRGILQTRYPNNHYSNNQKTYCYYLKDELEFWKEVYNELKVYIDKNDSKTLSLFLLKEFHEYPVKDIVEKLKGCDKK